MFVAAWVPTRNFVVVGETLYRTKILPGPTRAGRDGPSRFSPRGRCSRTNRNVALLAAAAARPWYFRVLTRARAITAAILGLDLIASGCLFFEGA